jgi:hypothetical protein
MTTLALKELIKTTHRIMRAIKFTFAIAALASISLILLALFSAGSIPEPTRDAVTELKLGPGNEPVYMAGCQTHNPPVTPEVIYPTVNTNFMARLCALEVPPPEDAIMLQRQTSGAK